MVIVNAELGVQRRLTQKFITADSVRVVLVRAPYTDDGAGGVIRGTPAPLPEQLMRLIPQQDTVTTRTTANGEEVVPGYVLLGRHDADVERWDQFTLNGRDYQVLFVAENRQYQTKSEVAYLGS